MDKPVNDGNKCREIKQNGQQCEANTMTNLSLCYPHDPSKVEEETPLEAELAKIERMIEDPDSDPVAVMRLITVATVAVAMEVQVQPYDPAVGWPWGRHYNAILKALRQLRRSIMDTQFLNNKDTLNFDGPKFTYVLGQVVDLFATAMKDLGVPEEVRNNVMRQYHDLYKVEEPELRRKVRKIEEVERK